MIAGGVELILGLVNDPQFGHLLVIGPGGIFVELFQDRQLLLLPVTGQTVREALLNLKSARLLQGARGRPAVNIDAIVDAALKLARMAADFGDRISEIDINPLIALENGVVAVDALAVFKA
jgi:acyl-CoA synthetase (NDP forming)